MEAVIGLLLMLLGVSHGVETYCDGRINGAQCYGALGGTVVLRLMDSTSGIHKYQWVKNKTVILIRRNDKFITNLLETRSSFTPSDGTFRISNLSRTDAGEYSLTIYETSGRVLDPQILQLNIQAPVSSVLLVAECLSQGEMRVSCSSEGGDSPQYSWTLDGHTLTDAQLLSGNKDSNTITLRQDISGQLVCSVSNHVSQVSKEEAMSTCGFIFIDCISNGTHISQWVFEANNTLCVESTTARIFTTEGKEPGMTMITVTEVSTVESLLICGLRTAVMILILIGIAVYFIWKKKKYEKAEGSAVPVEMDYENSVVMVEVRSSASEL
ncbi:T-cell surface antigen CD2-like isoform 1-T3 [Acanthopagrus schlegelii]